MMTLRERLRREFALHRLASLSGLFAVFVFSVVVMVNGCTEPEYQPPKDAIPDIPPGRTDAMDELAPPKK